MDMEDVKQEQMFVEQGNLLDSQGEFRAALAAYDHALDIFPGDADALYDKGQTLAKLGMITEAAKCFDTATRMYVGDWA